MMARHSYKMMLPRKYITVEPTDAFRMPSKADPNYFDEYYCTEVHIGANGLLEVHAVDHYYVDPNLKPTDQVEEDLDAAVGGNQNTAQTSQTRRFHARYAAAERHGHGRAGLLCDAVPVRSTPGRAVLSTSTPPRRASPPRLVST